MNNLQMTMLIISIIIFLSLIIAIIIRLKRSFLIIDRMSGKTFENFIAKLYKKLGYISINTKTSGDQGIDVIVKKTFLKLGIQTTRYDRPVGNKAVQEAVAGKKYYKLDKVAVITNNYFTRSAKELAKVNGVELIERDKLKVILIKAYKK